MIGAAANNAALTGCQRIGCDVDAAPVVIFSVRSQWRRRERTLLPAGLESVLDENFKRNVLNHFR